MLGIEGQLGWFTVLVYMFPKTVRCWLELQEGLTELQFTSKVTFSYGWQVVLARGGRLLFSPTGLSKELLRYILKTMWLLSPEGAIQRTQAEVVTSVST